MSMFRSYLLKNNFWAKKGNEKDPNNSEKVYIKHNEVVGGIWAIIENKPDRKGVKIIVEGLEYFFNNFDKLDAFLNRLEQKQNDFMRIVRRRDISHKLRTLEI
ncbi:MAG: hypothetical protein ACFFBP_05390 [Promethearchaeota archaeon]